MSNKQHDDDYYDYLMNEAEVEPKVKRKAPENPGVPESLLLPGEIVIILLKPSMWLIILSSLRELTIVTIFYAIAFWLEYQYDALHVNTKEINTAAGFIYGAILLYRFIDWVARLYVMTDRRIIRVKGIFKVDVYTARLSKIQNLKLFFTVRERVCGIGTIGFSTAGEDGIEAYWLMIAKPLKIYEKIERAIDRYS